jgi:hypothetical protein
LAEGEDGKELRLKNGARVDATLGRGGYLALRGLLAREPELFRSLLAVARSEPVAIPERHDARLRAARFLRPDGTIVPSIRDVLLSAYRETPDGPALVNPFQFASEEEVREEERADDAAWDRLRRGLRNDDNPGTGGPHGRS